jgi:hypothetical protein
MESKSYIVEIGGRRRRHKYSQTASMALMITLADSSPHAVPPKTCRL